MKSFPRLAALTLAVAAAAAADAAPTFVNGLTIDGTTLDASGGVAVNDGRLGFFSDIYYDAQRDEWYALSDRGPGGGTLDYEVRIHRFTLDVNAQSGAISNFQVQRTFIFRQGAQALNGLAPGDRGAARSGSRPRGHRRASLDRALHRLGRVRSVGLRAHALRPIRACL